MHEPTDNTAGAAILSAALEGATILRQARLSRRDKGAVLEIVEDLNDALGKRLMLMAAAGVVDDGQKVGEVALQILLTNRTAIAKALAAGGN